MDRPSGQKIIGVIRPQIARWQASRGLQATSRHRRLGEVFKPASLNLNPGAETDWV
jgi:hypothetical protein